MRPRILSRWRATTTDPDHSFRHPAADRRSGPHASREVDPRSRIRACTEATCRGVLPTTRRSVVHPCTARVILKPSPIPSPRPPPSPLSHPNDTMKSVVWFMTLLHCLELTHAAHITPIRGHRHHRGTSTNLASRDLKRRAKSSRNPPSTPNNGTTTKVDIADNCTRFPSLGFEMPNTIPSSLTDWWSDYTSEVGFLGFSYAVSACMSPGSSTPPLFRDPDALRSFCCNF